MVNCIVNQLLYENSMYSNWGDYEQAYELRRLEKCETCFQKTNKIIYLTFWEVS